MPVESCGDNRHFYPRSPCGERQDKTTGNIKDKTISIHALLAESDHNVFRDSAASQRFLSTLSLRRATNNLLTSVVSSADFYPRSPCGERLEFRKLLYPGSTNFYPRSPCGERPVTRVASTPTTVISIHALLAESDSGRHIIDTSPKNFYPRSPCGERQSVTTSFQGGFAISIHALLAESDCIT